MEASKRPQQQQQHPQQDQEVEPVSLSLPHQPVTKKTKKDWKEKCVVEFGLTPIPSHAQDRVGTFSQETWKRYYEYRSIHCGCDEEEEEEREEDNDSDDEDEYESSDDEDESGEMNLKKQWKHQLDALVQQIDRDTTTSRPTTTTTTTSDDNDTTTDEPTADSDTASVVVSLFSWPCHLSIKDLCIDDDDLRTAEFVAHVWSPYEIPNGIKLVHFYHQRPRSSSYEFSSSFEYSVLDFVENTATMKKLCSVCYKDEELRFDVIDVKNLTLGRIRLLKRHLWGPDDTKKKKTKKHQTNSPSSSISDFDFCRLLLASMGVFDFSTLMAPYDGHEWVPYLDQDFRKEMKRQGEDEDSEYFANVSWLEHAVRKATNALRPTDVYYKPPKMEDAPGYYEYSQRMEEQAQGVEVEAQGIRDLFSGLAKDASGTGLGEDYVAQVGEQADQLCKKLADVNKARLLHKILQTPSHKLSQALMSLRESL